MTDLKAHCENTRPLELIRYDASEPMVIYDSKPLLKSVYA